MQLTTIVVCEDNVPTEVAVLSNDAAISAHLLTHYQMVWSNVEARGERPQSWQEIRDELQSQNLLADRDIAHIFVHEVSEF